MPTLPEILDAMQFDLSLLSGKLNTTGDPAYVIDYQFADNSQPADLWTAYSGWTTLTAAEKTAIHDAMDHIETFLNVSFVEVTGSSDPTMNIGKVSIPGSTAGYGGYRYSAWSNGDLADYDNFVVYDNTINLASDSAYNLILHELGHALALKHPFDGGATLPSAFENNKYTVMSYSSNPDNGQDSDAMMLYDIYALQDWWGATSSYNHGNTTYTGPRTATIDPLWDTGGQDTIDASAYGNGIKIDLRQGFFSRFGSHDDVVIPFGVVIEEAIGGSGADTITGNAADNTLNGGSGDDSLLGGAGSDTLEGGDGNDTLNGGDGRDRAVMGAGNDLYQDNGQGGVNGQDTVFGNQGNDTISGGNGNDVFHGDLGNDLVQGRLGNDKLYGGDGFDTLDGGDGNDIITGGNGRDKAFLGAGADLYRDNSQGGVNGQDTVRGNQGNDTIEGGAGNDWFWGDLGNDVIRGRKDNDKLYGGDGFDTLDGGDGNDSVHGGNGRDLAILGNGDDIFFDISQGGVNGRDTVFGGNGNDTVQGGAGDDVFYGGNGNDSLVGANDNDKLYGGDNADTLLGGNGNDSLWGGNGIDQLTGGNGLDTFFFDNGFGTDTVFGFSADNGEDISLAGVTAITGFADLLANHLVSVGGIAQIVDGANTILLDGVTFTDVGVGLTYSADDFLF